jgi:serine/threonine-protein kinase
VIRLQVLGPVELKDGDGRELRSVLAQPKRLALLATLVVGPPGFRRRDSLLALLWPELDEARARAALNQAVRFLRRELGGSADSVILSRGVEEVGVDPSAIWCDATVFRDLMDRDEFSDALRLYRGDLLEGFFAEQGAGFVEWLDRERDLLRSSASRAARAVAGSLERERNFTPAVAAARRAVKLADADERVMRELLQLLDRLGDRAGALQAYASFENRLSVDFDAAPAAETVALIERIRARATPADHAGVDAAPARVALPAPVAKSPPAHHAPRVVIERVPTPPAHNSLPEAGALANVLAHKWWLLAGALIGVALTLTGVRLFAS